MKGHTIFWGECRYPERVTGRYRLRRVISREFWQVSYSALLIQSVLAASAGYSLLPAKAKEDCNIKVRVAIMETIMIL